MKETVSLKFLSALPRNTLSEWVTDLSGAGAVARGCPLILGHLKCACNQRELTDLDTLSEACAKFGFRSPSGAIGRWRTPGTL